MRQEITPPHLARFGGRRVLRDPDGPIRPNDRREGFDIPPIRSDEDTPPDSWRGARAGRGATAPKPAAPMAGPAKRLPSELAMMRARRGEASGAEKRRNRLIAYTKLGIRGADRLYTQYNTEYNILAHGP